MRERGFGGTVCQRSAESCGFSPVAPVKIQDKVNKHLIFGLF